MALQKKYSEYKGFSKIEFEVNNRNSYIVCPKHSADGNPWAWRCEFFGAFDSVDMALLNAGWHLAYHQVSDMYGCPDAVKSMRDFQKAVYTEFGLVEKTVLFGFSRGGLYAVNYAAEYPEETALIYLDAPVLDIRSWPCGAGGDEKCADECLKIYNLTRETLADFKGSPIEQAERIAKLKIPVIIVAGGSDTVVPYSENGEIFARRMSEAGGIIHTIVKPDCGHHPHSLENPKPVVDFIINNIKL